MTGFGGDFGEKLDVIADFRILLTYLFGAGVKYYPLPSGLHLQLGADVGLACMISASSKSDVRTSRSPFGVGGRISVSYDFDSDLTGSAFLIGTQLLADFIEKELVLGFSIFAKYAYKR
jgi:hypothetical protein